MLPLQNLKTNFILFFYYLF